MRVTLPFLLLLVCAGCNNTSALDAALRSLPPEAAHWSNKVRVVSPFAP